MQELIYYAYRLSPDLKKLEILPMSDVHYGNEYFSLKHFLRTRDYIRDTEYAYTVLNGDLCEAAIRSGLSRYA